MNILHKVSEIKKLYKTITLFEAKGKLVLSDFKIVATFSAIFGLMLISNSHLKLKRKLYY